MPPLREGWWDGVPFDRILLDAPCSALGVIRRHPDIRLRRSPQDLAKMPAAQMRLLAAAFGMLARGGRLVYATCTLTRRENGELIRGFLQRTAEAAVVPSRTGTAGRASARPTAAAARSSPVRRVPTASIMLP